MPGFIPIVGDFLQARIYCSAGAQLSENVLHYRVTGITGGGVALDAAAQVFEALLEAAYKAWMPVTAEWRGVTLQNLTAPITNPFPSTIAAGAGTAIGALAPRQASGLVSTRTALGGRSNRGRVFVGLLSSNWVGADGELTGAGLATLANIASRLGSDVVIVFGASSMTIRLLVRHPDTIGPPRVPNGTSVTGLSASTGIATQRRRGDFGAPNTPLPP